MTNLTDDCCVDGSDLDLVLCGSEGKFYIDTWASIMT